MKTRKLQYRFLTELGEIIHKAKSGRLILKLFEMTKINAGDTISDSHGKKIGNVNDAREEILQTDKSDYTIKAKRNGTEMNFEIKIPKKTNSADL